VRRRLDDTARALGGEVIAGDPGRVWDRAAIDSRAVAGGELFFALEGERTLIDDSYNSNPDALARALAGAAELGAGRLVAVLGDMLELGPEAPRFHREAGERAARLGFSPLAGVGELARELAAAAREAGAEAEWLPDAAAAADWAEATVRPGDLVLVKGSRGVGLDAVVERLLGDRVEGGVGRAH